MMRRALLLAAALAAPLPVAAQSLAVIHARAWTMTTDAPIEDATIIVNAGRVTSVTRGGAVPAGLPVIDAKDQPVTPGLYNAATQLGLVEVSSTGDTRDATAKGELFGAAFDVSFALNGNSALVSLARADGVTGATSYPGGSGVPPFGGLAAEVRLRDGSDILGRAGIALFVTIGGSGNDAQGSRAVQWQRLRAAFDEARVPPPADRATISLADAAVLRRVLARTLPIAITTHRESDIRQALRFAADYGVRTIIVGGSEAWRVGDALARANIPVVLDPGNNLPGTFDQLGARQDAAALLARAGVRVAFGNVGGAISTSYNAGIALREGAGLAVANGLPYADALRAITTAPRAMFGELGGGTLAPGSKADLVVWDGDPLEPVTNAVAVVIEGKSVSTESRQSALALRYLKAP